MPSNQYSAVWVGISFQRNSGTQVAWIRTVVSSYTHRCKECTQPKGIYMCSHFLKIFLKLHCTFFILLLHMPKMKWGRSSANGRSRLLVRPPRTLYHKLFVPPPILQLLSVFLRRTFLITFLNRRSDTVNASLVWLVVDGAQIRYFITIIIIFFFIFFFLVALVTSFPKALEINGKKLTLGASRLVKNCASKFPSELQKQIELKRWIEMERR